MIDRVRRTTEGGDGFQTQKKFSSRRIFWKGGKREQETAFGCVGRNASDR